MLNIVTNIVNIVKSRWTDFVTGIIFAGECIGRFTNRKIPYCVKFNPDEVMFCNHLSFLLF